MTGFKTYFKSINEDEGIVEAYVSVFGNVDLAGEMVVHGAFTKSLQKKLPKGVYMHDWSRPVSTTIEAEEVPAGDARLPEQIKDLGGLRILHKYYKDITDSWQTFLKIKNGLIDEYSIGYDVIDSEVKDGVRLLTEMWLIEFSPVLIGANQATLTTSIKSLGFNEHFLTAGAVVKDAANRAIERASVREQKAGRTFSQANHTALSEFAETVIDAGKKIKELLQTATEKSTNEGEQKEAEQLAIARIKILQLKQQGFIK